MDLTAARCVVLPMLVVITGKIYHYTRPENSDDSMVIQVPQHHQTAMRNTTKDPAYADTIQPLHVLSTDDVSIKLPQTTVHLMC